MTTVEATTERATLVRSFELPLADSWDGRTLDTRIVPYNTPATVADPPDYTPYQEAFLPGAFQRQLSTPGRDRVFLNFEHEQGLRGVVGQSLRFTDQADGLHASFGVHENTDGDKALMLIRSGVLTGLSLEFAALASRRVDGIVQRVRAQLDKVSLCRFPAYEDAVVLAVRQEPDDIQPPPLPDLTRSAAVDERLARLGYLPLEDTMSEDELAHAARSLVRRGGPDKAAEARRLLRHYHAARLDPPGALRRLAGSA